MDKNYQSHLDNNQQVSYEFPIGKNGKKSDFIAGNKIREQEDNELGEPSPVFLKNGPRQDRKCRDFICLIIFLFFIFYYILVFFEMIVEDFQFERFSVPHDPDHRPCGHLKFKDHHFIYFASPDSQYLYRTVCVKQCPSKLPQDLTGYTLDCIPNSVISSCEYSPTKNVDKQFLIYETTTYLNSICLPIDKHFFDEISPALSINRIYQEVGNIKKTMHIIILASILSFIFGCIFFGFLGQCGDFLTWFFIFCFVTFVGLLGSVFFFRGTSGTIPIIESADNEEELEYIKQRILSLRDYRTYFIILAVICWIFSLTTLALVVYFNKKIKIIASQLKVFFILYYVAIALNIHHFTNYQISAHFILQNKLILIVPFVLFSILLCFFIFWVYLCIQIIGTGVVISEENRQPFNQYKMTSSQVLKLLIHFIFIVVFRGFLVGCSDFLITSTCSIWYYKKDKDQTNALWQLINCQNANSFFILFWALDLCFILIIKISFQRLVKYHIGSIIFLGAVNTILDYPIRISNVVCVRQITDYLSEIKKKDRNQCKNYVASIVLCSCVCFDKILRFLNRYALLYIALSGDSYYDSSKQSYYLLKRNNRRFKFVRNLGGYFFTVSKLFLALLSSLICYFIVLSVPYYYQKAFFVLSYTTASFFIGMYQDSSTSLILISYVDEEVEKHHYGKEDAYNCPHIIRGYLNSLRNNRV